MSRWLKRLLVGGLVILVLLGIGVGVLLATIDQQAYKAWLQDQVRERYGRTLDIKGEVAIRVFPVVGLQVNKVELSEPNSAERFASINQANISVSIKPLFQRRISIDQVSLDGLDVNLKRDRQGNWNFNDLMGPGRSQPGNEVNQTSQSVASASSVETPMTINVHRLDIKQSTVAVLDRSKPWMAAKNLNASVIKASAGGEYDLVVSASVDLPAEGQADLSFKSKLGFNENFSQLTAKGSEVKLTKGQQHGKQGFKQVELVVNLEALMAELSADRVSGNNLTLRAKGLKDADRFEWAGDMASFSVERSAGAIPAFGGRLRLDGANALDAKYQVSGLSFKPGQIETRSVRLDIGIKQANRLFKLDAELPLTIKPGKTIHAASIKGGLHLADPGIPAGSISLPFTGEVGYDLAKRMATWRLASSFLDSPIDLSGKAIDLDKDIPRLSVSINTNVLDLNALDAFFNQPKPAVKVGHTGSSAKTDPSAKTPSTSGSGANAAPLTSPAPSTGTSAVVTTQPLAIGSSPTPSSQPSSPPQQQAAKNAAEMDLSWMRKLDLDLQVRASRFVWDKLHASQLQFQIGVQNGKAQLRSLQASLYGGTLSAEGGLTDSNGLPAYLKGKLNAVEVEPLITALTGDSMLGGLGTMSFELKASAIDSSALLRTLDGQSQIDIKQGYIRGLDLNKGVEALSDPAGRAKDLPLAIDKSKRTNLSVMQTQVLFGQGLARLHKLNLASNNIRITEGKTAQIGLLDGSLDVVANVQFSGNLGLPGARVAIQVRSLMVPMHVGGTLQDPQVRIHWQSMPEDALKQSLQQLLMQGVIGGAGGFVGVGNTNPSAPGDSGTQATPGTTSGTPPNPAKQLENVIRGLFGR